MNEPGFLREEPPPCGGGGETPSPILEYLPAQKWLKDRVVRTFGFVEQEEYKRIFWALIQTKRLMAEIDASIKEHGGWPLK